MDGSYPGPWSTSVDAVECCIGVKLPSGLEAIAWFLCWRSGGTH